MNGIPMTPSNHLAIQRKENPKTQTRRLGGLEKVNLEPDKWKLERQMTSNMWSFVARDEHIGAKSRYHVGETVYIKEAHYLHGHWECLYTGWIFHRSVVRDVFFPDTKPVDLRIIKGHTIQVGWYLRSPLFMPAWAARYFIKITDVKPERLKQITVEDCIAEGLSSHLREHDAVCDLRNQYIKLWDSINKKQKWASNPWCFVYSFRLRLALLL